MKSYIRGNTIAFSKVFLDTSGEIVNPSSANISILYPSSGWPLNGENLVTTQFALALTSSSTASTTWAATWWSGNSQPGDVFWSIKSTNHALSSTDGQFRLVGNPANLLNPSMDGST